MRTFKNITKLFMSFTLFVALVLSFGVTTISANESDPDNDGIPGTEGLDYFIVHTENIPKEKVSKSTIKPMAGPGYSVRNSRHSGGGNKQFAIPQIGYPGGEIIFEDTYSTSMRVDTTTGIGISDISAELGFSVSRTCSRKLGYHYKVPSKANGKTVKSATLSPRLNYNTYSYDFYFLESKIGSGIAESPLNIDYVVRFEYK